MRWLCPRQRFDKSGHLDKERQRATFNGMSARAHFLRTHTVAVIWPRLGCPCA
jgi:hypothetical protein